MFLHLIPLPLPPRTSEIYSSLWPLNRHNGSPAEPSSHSPSCSENYFSPASNVLFLSLGESLCCCSCCVATYMQRDKTWSKVLTCLLKLSLEYQAFDLFHQTENICVYICIYTQCENTLKKMMMAIKSVLLESWTNWYAVLQEMTCIVFLVLEASHVARHFPKNNFLF